MLLLRVLLLRMLLLRMLLLRVLLLRVLLLLPPAAATAAAGDALSAGRQAVNPFRYQEQAVNPFRYQEQAVHPFRYQEQAVHPFRYQEQAVHPLVSGAASIGIRSSIHSGIRGSHLYCHHVLVQELATYLSSLHHPPSHPPRTNLERSSTTAILGQCSVAQDLWLRAL